MRVGARARAQRMARQVQTWMWRGSAQARRVSLTKACRAGDVKGGLTLTIMGRRGGAPSHLQRALIWPTRSCSRTGRTMHSGTAASRIGGSVGQTPQALDILAQGAAKPLVCRWATRSGQASGEA
eukprot:8453467-Alexandrium_andersonii.AAC.1